MSSILPIGPVLRIAGPYVASAGQTTFTYAFALLDAGDLAVETAPADDPDNWSLATLDLDYGLTPAPPHEAGGSVVFLAPRPAGSRVRIVGAAVIANVMDPVPAAAIDSFKLNRMFDRVTIWAQENRRDLDTALDVLRNLGNDGSELAPHLLFSTDFDGNRVWGLAPWKANSSTQIATTGSFTGGGNLSDDRTISLVGDAADTSPLCYYGTNTEGDKGFHPLPEGAVPTTYPTRSLLKASPPPAPGQTAYLSEAGREGRFVWRNGNYSTQIAADIQEGIYIKANSVAASSGAWVRATNGAWNVRWFGAVGDGTTNDAPAFNACASLVPTIGGHIYIPNGEYYFASPWMISNKSITISGSGIKVALLFFAPGLSGIIYATNDMAHNVNIYGISVISMSTTGSQTGISIIFPDNGGSSWKNATIRDVVVDGTDTVSNYRSGNVSQDKARFSNALYVKNVATLSVDNFTGRGKYSENAGRGILIEGWTVDFRIMNSWLSFYDVAIVKHGALEGFNIIGVTGLHCNEFVRVWANSSGTVGTGGVAGYIVNCHSGNVRRGIDIRDFHQFVILNNILYQDGDDIAFYHAYIERSTAIRFIGNHMNGNDNANGTNIHMQSGSFLQVSDNFIWGRFTSVYAAPGTGASIVTGNFCDGSISLDTGSVNANNVPV
ncbi:Uncharacterised protein [Starkeya nomas]|uniref:Rhamnogalacturonase A/B/Epimerase-like pectate lyase domain-containing protein n=1 Tax=Starkeya nomas TaxID=2666134 RepID=A0A5S9NZM6_9HYPH|nr:glycosyl hydrolase family 28-related protein [Starkeya nomas]CAA0096300.1 Uncharacterised protein [Starkeya nomas]